MSFDLPCPYFLSYLLGGSLRLSFVYVEVGNIHKFLSRYLLAMQLRTLHIFTRMYLLCTCLHLITISSQPISTPRGIGVRTLLACLHVHMHCSNAYIRSGIYRMYARSRVTRNITPAAAAGASLHTLFFPFSFPSSDYVAVFLYKEREAKLGLD